MLWKIFSAGVLAETPHFSWIYDVESSNSCHYSLPAVGSRLPDSPALSVTPLLLLSAVANNVSDISGWSAIVRTSSLVISMPMFISIEQSVNWSRGISLSAMTSVPSDQYVRLPLHGDIKLIVYTRCYTTYINILPISQVS